MKLLKKSSSCPNNNRGVTYQSDGKVLADGVEYLNRGAKLVCYEIILDLHHASLNENS